MSLTIQHISGKEPLQCHALFHTYFAVPDIHKATLKGLEGLSYQDQTKGMALTQGTQDALEVRGEVDRVYANVPMGNILILSNGMGLTREGLSDVVVWNPWIEKSKSMVDFPDEDYKRMICVEAGSVSTGIQLAPGSTWVGSQTLSVVTPPSSA